MTRLIQKNFRFLGFRLYEKLLSLLVFLTTDANIQVPQQFDPTNEELMGKLMKALERCDVMMKDAMKGNVKGKYFFPYRNGQIVWV